jgi:hypothetical protein
MIDLTTLYAALATVAAAFAAQRAWHWRQSYVAALRMFSTLPRPMAPTPHQRGAETRKRREIERKRRHMMQLMESMGSKADG